jgi:outer membrane protein
VEEERARHELTLARSPLYPSVDTFASYTWLEYQPAALSPFGPFPLSQEEYPTYGFTVNQLIFDFGKTFSGISASKYSMGVKHADTRRTRNSSALEFIIAYLDLLESERMLIVSLDEIKRFELHLRNTRALFDEGMVTKNDVLETEVILSDARQRALTAENLRDIRASRINSLIFRPLNEPVDARETAVSHFEGISLDEAWNEALKDRPEIQQADALINARREEREATRAEFLPTIYVSGGYTYEENEYRVRDDNWSVIAGVKLNLFSGGATVAKMGKIAAEMESLKIAMEKLGDAIRLEVKSAYLELESAKKRVEVTEKAVAQSEENLRLQKLRYREGVATATDMIDAVTLRSKTEANYWSGIYGVKRAEARLYYAVGRDLFKLYSGPVDQDEETAP